MNLSLLLSRPGHLVLAELILFLCSTILNELFTGKCHLNKIYKLER